MRVLVISDYDDLFNAVRPEGALFIGLHQIPGIDVQIMTHKRAKFVKYFKEAGMRVIDFHPDKKFDKASVLRIRRELIEQRIDILHLFNNKAIINGLRATKGLDIKVLTYRGYTGNVHWWNPANYLTHLHPRVQAITCVSDAVKEVFDEQLFFSKNKAVTVSKGHDLAWYKEVEAGDLSNFGFPENAIIVSVVANARKMKGIPYLLQALEHLSKEIPLYFLLIGRGLDTPEAIKKLEQTAWRERVVFAGFRTDALSLIKACDISLLPSIKGEGLSKVLLESLFLARPTIMTDIGGNKGLAIHEETGLIIPPRDPKAMADALSLLAKNTDLRKKIGLAGQLYISTHYTVARSVAELKKVYEDLMKA